LEEKRGKIKEIKADNSEYDEKMAKIGSDAEAELYESDDDKGGKKK